MTEELLRSISFLIVITLLSPLVAFFIVLLAGATVQSLESQFKIIKYLTLIALSIIVATLTVMLAIKYLNIIH